MFFAKFLTAIARWTQSSARQFIIPIVRVNPTLSEEFLSFLVSKFVELCQNGGDPVKGGTEHRVDPFCFRALRCFIFFFFFFHSIFDSLHERREKRLSSIRALLLFVRARSFPNRVFPACEIANRYRNSQPVLRDN